MSIRATARLRIALLSLLAPLAWAPAVESTGLLDGLRAYTAGDYLAAEALLRPLSRLTDPEGGHAQADMYLGRLYAYGLVEEPRDDAGRIAHLRVAAEAGITEGQRLLAEELSLDPEADWVAIAHWYARAAKAGDAAATYHLGELFEYGLGLSEDRAQAAHFYRLANERGEPLGAFGLERLDRRDVAEEIRDRASRLAETKPLVIAEVAALPFLTPSSRGSAAAASTDDPAPQVITLAPPSADPNARPAPLCTPLAELTDDQRALLKRARLFDLTDRPEVWAALNASLACRLASGRFGALIQNGFVSINPDNRQLRRSVRTNNPGALNISTRRWERVIPGFAGVHADDGKGNKTVIYHSPEQGVMALFLLLTEIYDFGDSGKIDVARLATWYGGRGPVWGQRYLAAWDQFSPRNLRAERYLSINDSDAMVDLMTAIAAFEIGRASPLHREQFTLGLTMARELQQIAAGDPQTLASLTPQPPVQRQ